MIDKKVFEEMRADMEQFDTTREKLIKLSRDVLKLSKSAIYSLHRNDTKTAQKQLKEARTIIAQMDAFIKKDAHLAMVGAYTEALEEFVEAACYAEFILNQRIPSSKELGVDTEIYLPGLCDLVGELVRKALNSVLNNDVKTALQIKKVVEDIYAELMLFDFRNSPLRKKFDSIKYHLEKLEDLAVKITLR